jgi:predicted nuclease of predicted toxin-antitoxin system
VRFFLDHDVPDPVGDVLRQAGHSVTKLREVLPLSAEDPEVFAYAVTREMILITCNRDDFLPLAAEQPHPGLIILIRRRNRHGETSRVMKLVDHAGESGLANNINFA